MSTDRILLTGATSDLGCTLLGRLYSRDPRPEVLAHGFSGLQRLQEWQAKFGTAMGVVQSDLATDEGAEALVAAVRERWGHPGAILHFAGLPLRLERFRDWNQARIKQDLAIQFHALAWILHAFLPAMAKAERPSKVIFVLSSVVHGVPPKFMSMYTATKYAQLGLMKALAAEYSGTSVCIQAVSPSMVETRYLAEIPSKAIELSAAQTPGGRNLQPDEVAEVLDRMLFMDTAAAHGSDLILARGGVF